MSFAKFIKKPIFACTIVIFLFLMNFSAYAIKMNIDPPRVKLSISPGGTESGYVTVLNYDQNETIHVKVYVNDLVYAPDGSNDFLPEGTTPWTAADWLKIGPTEFDLGPSDQMKVRYVVEVPEDAKGGRYGVVFFEISPPADELSATTGASINIRLGSIFFVTVKGAESYDVELQGLKVSKPDEDGAFDISCTVRNNSNILVRPSGPVKIIDSSKTEVAELLLNSQDGGIFPRTNREFTVRYDKKKLAPGEYFVQAVLDYGGEDYLGGQISFNVK